MFPVTAGPIATEMTKIPTFDDVAFPLLIYQIVFNDERHNSKVDSDAVATGCVGPEEIALDHSCSSTVGTGRRRRGLKPAIIFMAAGI